MIRPEVAVTGIGVLSPIGSNKADVLESLLAQRSGVALWESPLLAKRFVAATVPLPPTDQFSRVELPFLDRTTQFAIHAARQAVADAGILDFSGYAERAGVFYGTVRGGGHTEWEWVRQFHCDKAQTSRPYVIMGTMANAPAAQVSIRMKVFGPVATHTSACASSAAAIDDACRHIRGGELDVAIVGGAEAPLSAGFMAAWDGLRAMAGADADDPSRSCKPFSRGRSGLVLAEGAVFFVLESREHAERRGATIYGIVSGVGVASDAYHIGSPHSRGQVASMRFALHDAGITPDQLSYINAHATATVGGDPIEVASLKELLGDAAQTIPVSGTKAQHGHMLGAASAMELLVCLLAINHRFIPATAHLDDIDPNCEGLAHVVTPIMDRDVKHALSLSAGFGGTNVALVVSAANANS